MACIRSGDPCVPTVVRGCMCNVSGIMTQEKVALLLYAGLCIYLDKYCVLDVYIHDKYCKWPMFHGCTGSLANMCVCMQVCVYNGHFERVGEPPYARHGLIHVCVLACVCLCTSMYLYLCEHVL